MLTACTLLFSCQWWCVWPVKSALSSTAELIPPLCSKTCFALVLRANAATSFTTAPILYQRVHLCSLPQKHYSGNLKISWCFSFTTVFYKVDRFLTLCRKSWNIYYEEKRCGGKRAYFIVWRRSLQSIFFLSVLMLLHISLFYIDLGSPFFKLSTKLPQQQHRNRTTSNTTVHMCCCAERTLWGLSLRIAVYCTWLMQCSFTCYSCCCRAVSKI